MAALDVDQPTRAESAGFIGFRVAKRRLRVRPGPRSSLGGSATST